MDVGLVPKTVERPHDGVHCQFNDAVSYKHSYFSLVPEMEDVHCHVVERKRYYRPMRR
nr:MAG TPA: hypothetical protein [Caudoviricetes sp.]